MVILAALVGRIVGLLVAQTTDATTHARLEELTRAVERLAPDVAEPGDADQPDVE